MSFWELLRFHFCTFTVISFNFIGLYSKMEGVGKLPVILFALKFVHKKQEYYFMLRLTLLTASCNTNSSLSVTSFYELKMTLQPPK